MQKCWRLCRVGEKRKQSRLTRELDLVIPLELIGAFPNYSLQLSVLVTLFTEDDNLALVPKLG